jgi:hypothetical protein
VNHHPCRLIENGPTLTSFDDIDSHGLEIL